MQNKKVQQLNPIQGFKGGGYQDFRPISLETKEAEAAAAPLGVPESATDLPPDKPLSNREILDRVAAMERIKSEEDSQLPIPGIDASVEKASSSEPEQKQPLPSPPKTSPGLQTPSVPESKTQTSSSPAPVKPSAPTRPS